MIRVGSACDGIDGPGLALALAGVAHERLWGIEIAPHAHHEGLDRFPNVLVHCHRQPAVIMYDRTGWYNYAGFWGSGVLRFWGSGVLGF